MPPIRARDLRANIKEMGFEKGVVHTLELVMEEFSYFKQHLRELTELSSQCVDQLDKLIYVGSQLQDKIDQIKRDSQRGDEDDGDNR